MPQDAKGFYDRLGVSPAASEAEIKAAYRRLAKEHHPDTNAGNKEAADKFQKVQAAYEVLRKAEERKNGKVA